MSVDTDRVRKIVRDAACSHMIVGRVFARWFVALGVLLGVPYALFMGPLRVPDEAGHFYRTVELSRGHCVARPVIASQSDWRELDRYAPWRELAVNTSGSDLVRLIDNPDGGAPYSDVTSICWNLYPCAPYAPAAITVGLARIVTRSWLSLMYVGRIANLAVYLFMTCLALRLLPDFHLPLLCLALMPMTLHEAASLSGDAVTIWLAFLVSAYILKLSFSGDSSTLRTRDHLLITAAMIAIGFCKMDVWLAFLVLLIPAARFSNTRMRWLAATAYIGLALFASASWQLVNHANTAAATTVLAAGGIDTTENIRFATYHPLLLLSAVARTLYSLKYEYVHEFVGKLGFLNVSLPDWIIFLYVVTLLAVAVTQFRRVKLSLSHRALLIGIFVTNVVAVLAFAWVFTVPHASLSTFFAKWQGNIYGAQGRHFIPFAFLFLIALSNTRFQLFQTWMTPAALAVCVIANVIALGLVWDTYQAHTSTLPNRVRMALHFQFRTAPNTAAILYDRRIVSQSGKDAPIYFVDAGTRHLLLDKGWPAHHGYQPTDVIFIPAAYLDAIPSGNPLGSKYEGQLVRRPGSTPEDTKVYIVRDGAKQWIIDARWITSHGFRWPDDVKTIPAVDLDAMPPGPPLQ